DSTVLCEGDESFRLISETSDAAALVEKLERHIIADDVVIETGPVLVGFALVGAFEPVLAALNLFVPTEGQFVQAEQIIVCLGRRSKRPSVELLCLDAAATERVRSVLSAQGVALLAREQMELERMVAGVPLVPVDIGTADMPGEGGMELDALSFTKGCYLGQEVVARMHNVGRPQRTLFAVSGEGAVPECPLPIYNSEKKAVGELRSAVASDGGWLGVAILKHRFAGVGDTLSSDAGSVLVERVFRDLKGGEG
ncbi:MAG: tRNA-modifying protein YgfZ, partial [Opitutales bacterium]|nr:tRNA-modifying protein YgfZ [Opitutales bacterium]